MTKPNFAEMSTKELRSYVLQYRHDDEAFYALSDRITTEGIRVKSQEHFIELIEQKLRSQENQTE
jgi:hypothetical protein